MATLPHDTYANPTTPLWATASGNQNISSTQITLTPPGLPTATGGTITYSGGYTYHTFTSSGTFTSTSPLLVNYFAIGGGGGGGAWSGGGGGAGGLQQATNYSLPSGAYVIGIGQGGLGGAGETTPATNGANTTIGSIVTAYGGGHGLNTNSGSFSGVVGCGGGRAYSPGGSGQAGLQGGDGGNNTTGGATGGGGVGGNGGGGGVVLYGNPGGVGVSYFNGTTLQVGGGGGGGGIAGGTGGTASYGGGAGANGSPTAIAGGNGTANTGGGGGGGSGTGSGTGNNGTGGNGGSGIVIISYLTITPDVVLTNQGGVLAQNGFSDIATSLWSTTPATSNKIYMDSSNILSNSGSNLYFNGSLLVNSGDLSNISDWALYSAVSNIECSNGGVKRSINNANAITSVSVSASSNVTTDKVVANTISNATNLSLVSGATSVGLLTNSFPQITNSAFSSISNVVDRLVDIGGDATYSIVAKNGNRGNITIQANSGDNNETSYGQINLTANGTKQTVGSVQYSYGGLLQLTANTPILTGAGVVSTSAVKINGGGVNIYAGSFSSFGSLAGQLYLWGQLGTSLTCSASPPSPITAGSVYIYGSNGTKMDGLVQMSNLSNISGSGFTINGGGNSGSIISNFYSISAVGVSASNGGFERLPATTYISSPDSRPVVVYDLTIETFYQAPIPPFIPELKSSIYLKSGWDIYLNTSNGGRVLYNSNEVLTTATNPNWSTIPATQTANLSNYDLSNVGNVRGGATMGLYATNINVNAGLNMLNNTISNVSSVTGAYINLNATSVGVNITTPGTISLTGSTGIIISNLTNVNADLYANANLYRDIQGTDIAQPVIQSGTASGTGNSGSVAVTIPTAYIIIPKVFVTHKGTSPANTSVVVSTGGTFTIYWTNAGSGTQNFDWMSIGSYA